MHLACCHYQYNYYYNLAHLSLSLSLSTIKRSIYFLAYSAARGACTLCVVPAPLRLRGFCAKEALRGRALSRG